MWLAHVVAGHANAARREEEEGGREGRIHVLPLEQCAEWLQDLAAAGEESAEEADWEEEEENEEHEEQHQEEAGPPTPVDI